MLRETFFSSLKSTSTPPPDSASDSGTSSATWRFDACGEELLFITGFGATETAPVRALHRRATARARACSGCRCRASSSSSRRSATKLEARVRGPNITPGYWGDDALTQAAFDEEGFYQLGDAMGFVDPSDPAKGLIFDGRLAEDFKLSTGTWVSVGPLRARILAQGGGLAQDVVIAGHDRELRRRRWSFRTSPVPRAAAELARRRCRPRDVLDASGGASSGSRTSSTTLAAESTGSSTFVARAVLLDVPPSLDAQEITDKGSINQKAVLQHRAALVEDLYAATPPGSRAAVCREARPRRPRPTTR